MLVAYFDESGTHGSSAVTTVAGLLGDSVAWGRLELLWRRRLARDGIKCFHATECRAGEGEFRALSRERREALHDDLTALIASMGSYLVGVGMSVYTDDWKYGASDGLKRQSREPYQFCLLMVQLQIVQFSKETSDGDPVAFVFAKQEDRNKDYALGVHEVFQRLDAYNNIGHVGFGLPSCVVPLQVADLYAHETYRDLVRQYDESTPLKPVSRQRKVLIDGIDERNRVATIEMLHRTADRLDGLVKSVEAIGFEAPSLVKGSGQSPS
jgi:hypothetical protein